ncbi:NAD(P)-dependent oxidoreductase [Jiangella alkaliphila]|uniref:D-isomer specific 2-hydroxyacid dehydrogenase, NAD binding domain n=1 Tax=Jiangella alkaliphila TaxID=419479 RepID=A0A1H2LDY9_9ACTN|nr:NAD(P)-dependent oxidoreductase [Jiangella alkaliphila]SDU79139.1 D-isomer specific 2-hydroxyacid dehydrogenase, NAD binding domain [Jiangella alkaliphila]
MTDVIVVDEPFERHWSFTAEHAMRRWGAGRTRLLRLAPGDDRPLAMLDLPSSTTRLLVLAFGRDLALDDGALARWPGLSEAGFAEPPPDETLQRLRARGIAVYQQRNEGFWAQSVAEFALGLTIAGLRRIPQTYQAMQTSPDPWSYIPPEGGGRPFTRAAQFGDDPAFVSGTVSGKRVRVVGMGNIGTRYAAFCSMLGADVASWSRSAPDPVFHRSGTRREPRLEELVADADIFAPMVPHLPATEGLITAGLLDALPVGCLVVCVTRMQILDADALRRRVLADELALAADVFDIEPLPAGDPLLGRHNVVHTPHNAGRTIDANNAYADDLLDQFRRVPTTELTA